MAGRNLGRLEKAAQATGSSDLRVAAVSDLKGLQEIFEDADVVINCAGPFSSIGQNVISAALAADSHYLDTTGEQEFVRDCYERFESASRQARRVVVNACAFEVALGDWAAHVAAEALGDVHLDELTISYAFDSLSPTKGTQLSILDALGKQGVRWDDGRWIRVAPGSERRNVEYPHPFGPRVALSFPSPEVITLPRHVKSGRIQTYISIGADSPITRAAAAIAPVLSPMLSPLLAPLLRSTIGAIAESTIRASEASVPKSGRFALVAQATAGQKQAQCAISGEDIYALSAGIITLAAERLENEGELCGVLAPSEILSPLDALEEIASLHQLYLELP